MTDWLSPVPAAVLLMGRKSCLNVILGVRCIHSHLPVLAASHPVNCWLRPWSGDIHDACRQGVPAHV